MTGQPVYQLTSVSACQTSSSCSGGSDETKTTTSYDTVNINPVSTSSGNGSGTLTATSSMTYDGFGNLLTVDGPLSGTADTTRFRYNSARERIGTISPDPDGGGSLKHRAVRLTNNGEGLVTKVERGTVDSQSDSDWSAFSPSEAVEAAYDSNGRPTTSKLVSGSTAYALTQTSYDAVGRIQCVAQRMNPSEFASLPSDACTLDTAGSYGPDRIVKMVYDAAGQATQKKVAYGTDEEANDVTSTYTDNGHVATATDAEGNKTSYEYDGHDRLVKTRFPDTTKGAGTSSTTDYEQLTLDSNGNVTSRRLRDGNSIGFTIDALNRVTAKNLPGSEPDVSYTYDLLNRMTGASQTNNSLSFTYDALSRQLTEAGPEGTITSTWDIAGRRTRIDYPGSSPNDLYVNQEYLVTGEISVIREKAATSGAGVLATYAYDDLGRRTSLTRGNGSVLTYSYDNASRLSQLADNLSGTTYDQTLGFSYNPAGQIVQATRSVDLYAWGGHFNVNRSYSANGLNQYSAITSVSPSPTYDSRGNLASSGSTDYSYSSENLLISSASGTKTLSYDPARRLFQTSGSATTRLAYDGTNLIAEYATVNGSETVQRRYVYGPGADEPLVWYEGSGTSDRRFLHADERGSVIALTDSSGSVIAVNAYDEHGIPAAANLGRFQYTGQTWLTDLGMYYYKARIYSPTLGRFLQADPTGYGDGMNLYSYVGGDPVNGTDPSGLEQHNMTGTRIYRQDIGPGLCGGCSGFSIAGMGPNMAARARGTTTWTATAIVVTDENGNVVGVYVTKVEFQGGIWGTIRGAAAQEFARLRTLDFHTTSKTDTSLIGYFELSIPSIRGGGIVQHVFGRMGFGIVREYWEYWPVAPGASTTDFYTRYGHDDILAGWKSVTAVARFYEGLTLPSSFIRNNPATRAYTGDIWSTTIDPHLPLDNATPAVTRRWPR